MPLSLAGVRIGQLVKCSLSIVKALFLHSARIEHDMRLIAHFLNRAARKPFVRFVDKRAEPFWLGDLVERKRPIEILREDACHLIACRVFLHLLPRVAETRFIAVFANQTVRFPLYGEVLLAGQMWFEREECVCIGAQKAGDCGNDRDVGKASTPFPFAYGWGGYSKLPGHLLLRKPLLEPARAYDF